MKRRLFHGLFAFCSTMQNSMLSGWSLKYWALCMKISLCLSNKLLGFIEQLFCLYHNTDENWGVSFALFGAPSRLYQYKREVIAYSHVLCFAVFRRKWLPFEARHSVGTPCITRSYCNFRYIFQPKNPTKRVFKNEEWNLCVIIQSSGGNMRNLTV